MSRIVHLVCLGLFLSPAIASAQDDAPPAPKARTPAELAALIDRLLDAKRGDVPAAPAVDDADFLRRVSLDLIGRIPRVSESRAFQDESAADRRVQLVERMLESSGYVTAMGSYYRSVLLPANNNMQFFQFQNPQVNAWVEQKIRANAPYDKLVHEVIAGPTGFGGPRGGFGGLQPAGQPNFSPAAQAFYVANENKAENVASSVSRLFLGVRLECAQCHDHPFASWSRKTFWETAAFFPQLQQPRFENGKVIQPKKLEPREIAIPGTSDTVVARFMDKTKPNWEGDPDPRKVYADWVISKDNPYFAKVAVNRLWAHFMGQGFAEPVDDESTDENPVSHPELLDTLAREFVLSGYDVKHMVRAFTRTAAYQRSSEQTNAGQADVRLWARMPVRGLSAEQLYDSLAVAVGARPTSNDPQQQFRQFGGGKFDFLTRFASNDRKTDKQTSILQALAMMNGNLVTDATTLKTGNTLAAVADAPFMSTQQKVETLFLATVGRPPRSEERERFELYVDKGGARNDQGSALADVFWVLLNSSEFALNR